jgi:HEAT repeat protein
MRWTLPKLRTWHLLGFIAAIAALISVMQYRWTVEDEGYALIRRLRSLDPKVRAETATKLILVHPKERRAIGPLTELLFDADPGVRGAAARALLDLASGSGPGGNDDEAVVGPVKMALTAALGDQDPAARLEIARSLGFLGTEPKVIVPVLIAFAEDRDPHKRIEALSVLGRYARQSEPALVALFAALNHDDPETRLAATYALTFGSDQPDRRTEPRIIAALVKSADDDEPRVRYASIRGLGFLGGRMMIEVPRVLQALSDPDPRMRLTAASYLGWNAPGKRAPGVVQALERALNDPDLSVRRASATTLGQIGLYAEAALPTLRGRLDDPEEMVRRNAENSIEVIEKQVRDFQSLTLPQAIADLSDPDPINRSNAAARLEYYGARASKAVPDLIRCLDDREPEVRRAAASALGQLGPGAAVAVEKLAELAKSDENEQVRLSATHAKAILIHDPGETPGP